MPTFRMIPTIFCVLNSLICYAAIMSMTLLEITLQVGTIKLTKNGKTALAKCKQL